MARGAVQLLRQTREGEEDRKIPKATTKRLYVDSESEPSSLKGRYIFQSFVRGGSSSWTQRCHSKIHRFMGGRGKYIDGDARVKAALQGSLDSASGKRGNSRVIIVWRAAIPVRGVRLLFAVTASWALIESWAATITHNDQAQQE